MIEIELVNQTSSDAEFSVKHGTQQVANNIAATAKGAAILRHENANEPLMSTVQQWIVYATVNGITTETTTTASGNFRVTLSGSGSDYQMAVASS